MCERKIVSRVKIDMKSRFNEYPPKNSSETDTENGVNEAVIVHPDYFYPRFVQ